MILWYTRTGCIVFFLSFLDENEPWTILVIKTQKPQRQWYQHNLSNPDRFWRSVVWSFKSIFASLSFQQTDSNEWTVSALTMTRCNRKLWSNELTSSVMPLQRECVTHHGLSFPLPSWPRELGNAGPSLPGTVSQSQGVVQHWSQTEGTVPCGQYLSGGWWTGWTLKVWKNRTWYRRYILYIK